MSLDVRSSQRSLPVTLPEIRIDVRLAAARLVMGREGGDEDLLAAAFDPSDTVYWIAESAAARLREVAA